MRGPSGLRSLATMDGQSIREPRSSRMYLVECFAATQDDVEGVDRRAQTLGFGGHEADDHVEYLVGLVLRADEQVLIIVRGPDADAVRAASREAGLAVERVAELTITSGSPASRPPSTHRPPPRAAGCRR